MAKYYLFLLLVIIVSCKKYNNGPRVSVLPKKYRLVGDWKMVKITTGDNTTSLAENDELKIKNNGKYEYYFIGDSSFQYGKWAFSKDKTKLIFTQDSSQLVNTYKIIELRNREIKLSPNLSPDLVYTYVSK